MIPLEALTELVTIATEPWGFHAWYHVAPPTPQCIRRIQRELGVTIPEDYIHIAAKCPSYGGWLAGIGDDYEHRCHILNLNRAFRTQDNEPPLPPHLILLNHGHDDDCDCWDTRHVSPSGEHPIIYIDLGSAKPEPSGQLFESFRAYMEHFALYHARATPEQSSRRRAEELMTKHGIRIPNT